MQMREAIGKLRPAVEFNEQLRSGSRSRHDINTDGGVFTFMCAAVRLYTVPKGA
jgi:hypothetical protein